MSRHEFEHDNRTIFVGWDPMVTSYYMEINLPNVDPEDNPVVHYGMHEFELLTINGLEGALYMHSIELPKGLRRELWADRNGKANDGLQ